MSKSVVFSIAASACLFALVCADTSRACGGGGGGGGGKSGGFGGGAVAYATSFNTGFNPGFARGGGFNPVAAQKQYLAAQAASRRARLKPARIARTIKQREEMLASRAARRDVLIAQRLERERQKAQQQPLERETGGREMLAQRTWTDSTGEHQVAASLVGVKDGAVQLLKRDGRTVSVPLQHLSMNDQQWLSSRLGAPQPASTTRLAVVASR